MNDPDELINILDKETQEAILFPASDSEKPPAVEIAAARVPDGSETETKTESGGEEVNYLALKPSAYDLEKVPYLGDYLNAVELRGDLAALKRQKEIMAAMQEIANK